VSACLLWTIELCSVLIISDENGPYYWHIKSGTIQREAPIASPVDVHPAKDATSSSSVSITTFCFDFALLTKQWIRSDSPK